MKTFEAYIRSPSGIVVRTHVQAGRLRIVVEWALKRFAGTLDSTSQEMLEHIVPAIGRLKYALFV